MHSDRRANFRLPRADWQVIYLANGIAAGAILLTCWFALVWTDYEFHNWIGRL